MGEAWVPVIFAAIIVLGVVGGQVTFLVVKRLLPLLETLVQERRKGVAGQDMSTLQREMADMKARIDQLEAGDRRIDDLEAKLSFMQSLLEGRAAGNKLESGGGD